MKLDTKAFSLTLALLAAAIWLVLMVVSLITGLGERTISTLGSYHPFFSYSWLGMVVMVVEHFVGGYIFGLIFSGLYNKLICKKTVPEL